MRYWRGRRLWCEGLVIKGSVKSMVSNAIKRALLSDIIIQLPIA